MANQLGALRREEVYEKLRNQILSQKFKRGEQLSERQLSEKLGVARGTLRETFVRLANEGYIENVPGRGSYVKDYSIEEIKELLYVRKVLEGVAARFATQKINRTDIAKLEKLVGDIEKAYKTNQTKKFAELDMLFHLMVGDLSKNTTVSSLVRNNFGLKLMLSDATLGMGDLSEHRRIAEAIIAGDAEEAEKLMRDHIAISVDSNLDTIKDQKGASLCLKKY